ncbi:hypothetical protein CHELA20_10906 [Hyphomicrobiales bacterium]|nr:hypothetical protein CHELA20_10906 [Hyphomicrobiales bacterium]CAH1694193.1 hypothetical protein CHELA41_51136 [Hyphomicrobiales bacterium]
MFVAHHHMHVAGRLRGFRPAEFGVADRLSDGGLDDGRAGQSDSAAGDHHREMRRRGMERRVTIGRAEDRGCPWHGRLTRRRLDEGEKVEREAAEAPTHHIGNAASVGIAKQHDGKAEALGMLDQTALLAHARGRGRAGKNGRVDADHPHHSAVDTAEAGHDAVAGDKALRAHLGQRERSEFEPRSRVEKQVEALADRQATRGAMALDGSSAAHLHHARFAGAQVGDFRLMGSVSGFLTHGSFPIFGWSRSTSWSSQPSSHRVPWKRVTRHISFDRLRRATGPVTQMQASDMR